MFINRGPIYVRMPLNTLVMCALATFAPSLFFVLYAAKA